VIVLVFFQVYQKDATLYSVLYYCQCSSCFMRFLRPSSGAQNCTHSIWYMSNLLAANDLETPFTITEIHHAISSGGQNRAPGRDRISLEFYKSMWAFIQDDLCSIPNTMFFGDATTPQQKAGIIVCLPKPAQMLTPTHRRPITYLTLHTMATATMPTRSPRIETRYHNHN